MTQLTENERRKRFLDLMKRDIEEWEAKHGKKKYSEKAEKELEEAKSRFFAHSKN